MATQTKEQEKIETKKSAPAKNGNYLDENSTIMVLNAGVPGQTRTADKEKIEVDADKSELKLSKKLFASDTFTQIRKRDQQMRNFVRSRSLPSMLIRSGAYRLPLDLVEQVDQKMVEHETFRAQLVKDFIAEYEQVKADAKERLRSLYEETDYVNVATLKRQFFFEWRYVAVASPERLAKISPKLLAREQQKSEALLKKEVDLIRDALRIEFKKLVDHATAKLAFNEGEKKPVFRDSIVENINDFLETFKSRNLTQDNELSALIAQAKKAMKGVENADKLRSDDAYRAGVAEKFEAIRATLNDVDAVDFEPSRKITLDEDSVV